VQVVAMAADGSLPPNTLLLQTDAKHEMLPMYHW
jgi:hypothetical protein